MKQKSYFLNLLAAIILAVTAAACKSSSPSANANVDSVSWAMIPFVKVDSVNPVLTPGDNKFVCPILKHEVFWEEKDVFNPAAIVRDGKVWMIFRAEDKIGKFAGTSRLGLAVSDDGLHFEKMPEPIFYPENDSLKIYEWDGGVEDPRIVESPDGKYIMTYTSFDGTTARLMLATSNDLEKWSKHGIVLKGKYKNSWSKAGAIVAKQRGERIVAEKINGKYWMYFGDTDLFLLSSDDLINWQPLEENGKLKAVLSPRQHYFDSRLVESGPYALVRPDGILLLYNGMNLDSAGRDSAIAPGAYSGGQALFHPDDPSKVIGRMKEYFITPDKDYEITGQVNKVCFLEGMVPFRGKWFLYYGTADSKIAVAVHEENP